MTTTLLRLPRVGWRGLLRTIAADARRAQRDSIRRQRELQREWARHEREWARHERESAKLAEKARSAHEVQLYENYLQVLVSSHTECGDAWDWPALANALPPPSPQRSSTRELAARQNLASYKPRFFERMFGGAKQQHAALEIALQVAMADDAKDFEDAVGRHRHDYALWQARRELALGVSARDPGAYRAALEHARPFEELTDLGVKVIVTAAQSDVVVIYCEVIDDELVPTEDVKLTSAGKLSTKQMPAGRYWPLYQDWLASAAIRVGREVFAVLPISRAIVNVGRTQVNTRTGHAEPATLAAVQFQRANLEALNMERIDPSDALKNFPLRMKFKKTSGFEPVEPMGADESWISTG